MSSASLLLLGWALPLFCGLALWLLFSGIPRTLSAWLAAVGYGFPVGLTLCAVLAMLTQSAHVDEVVLRLWPWLLVLSACAGIGAWFARNIDRNRETPALALATPNPRWLSVIAVLLLLLLVWRAWLLLQEVILLQTFPWDAWGAWAIKPKTWYLLGHTAPFVSMHDWLKSADPTLRTNAAWSYPPLLPWIEVWFANAADGWNEPLINLAWWAVWIALLFAIYGQLHRLGLDAARAAIATYALGSLPLLDTHVALAGYADIWIAVFFTLATLCWLCWLRHGDRRQLLVAVLISLALPAIKLEGAVWMLCLWLAIGFFPLPPRRRGLAVLVAVVVVLFFALTGLPLPMPGLGNLHIGWTGIAIPGKGVYSLQWHWVAPELLRGLYTLPNWHLLWLAFPLALFWRWRIWRAQAETRGLAGLLALGGGFFFALFFLTDAGQWAEDFTSANRLILHIAPLAVIFVALTLRNNIGSVLQGQT